MPIVSQKETIDTRRPLTQLNATEIADSEKEPIDLMARRSLVALGKQFQ